CSVPNLHLHSFPTRRSSDLAFAVGCELYLGRKITRPHLPRRVRKWRVSPLAVLVFVAVGAVGFLVSFGGIANLIAYYQSPENYRSEEHTSELQSRSDLVCRL